MELQGFSLMVCWRTFPHGIGLFTGEINAIDELLINSPNNQIIGIGTNGQGNVFEISQFGLIEAFYDLNQDIQAQLIEAQATVTDIEHGLQDGDLTLFIGTDKGLLISQSNSGRDSESEEWRFFFSEEMTNITNSVGDLRTLTAGNPDNPAEVRNLLFDGPAENNPQILWFGTPSGLHQMRLVDNVISHSLQLENPGDEKTSSRDLNNIYSLFILLVKRLSLAPRRVLGYWLVIILMSTK